MATIIERKLKDGSSSYRIQVTTKDKGTGKYLTKVVTWRPDPTKTKRTNGRELNEFATKFEKDVRSECNIGYAESRDLTVKEFIRVWYEYLSKNKAPTYYTSLTPILKDIAAQIGGYKLRELNPAIIQRYIDNLKGEKIRVLLATNKGLVEEYKAMGLSKNKVCIKSGICRATLLKIERGGTIEYKTAEILAKAIGKPIEEMFTIIDDGKDYSNATKAKRYRTLRAMLGYALKHQYVDRNYATGDYIDTVKEERKPQEFLDDEEIKSLLIGLKNYENIPARIAIITLIFTGLRRGELCGLEWGDLDLDKKIMSVERSASTVTGVGVVVGKTKTVNSVRKIIMPDILVEELKEYKKWWDRFVFLLGDRYTGSTRILLAHDGNPIYPSTVRYWLKKILKDLGLKDVCVHSLRHSNITMQLAAGVPLKTVAARAGHSTTKVTADIYAHMIKSSDQDAANKLNAMLKY